MVNQKKTRKNKHLQFKLKSMIEELKSMTPKSFYGIATDFEEYDSFQQKAIRIVSEEYKEKLYFFKEYYKNNYNTKKNIERTNKLSKLYEKDKMTFEEYPEYKTLDFYKNGMIDGPDKTDFEYYPDILQQDFTKKILSKKEFIDNIETGKPVEREDNYFSLTPSQTFLKNYISTETPYNGILLFHGTGVGKTCTALSIAEQFIDHIKNNSESDNNKKNCSNDIMVQRHNKIINK